MIEFNETFTKKQILEEPRELATQAIFYFFERFQWEPNKEMIIAEQEKFLARKI